MRAQAQGLSDVAAVRRLLHCPRDFSFLVQRYPHAAEATSSIGSIDDVLTRAAAKPASAAATRQPSKAKRRAAQSSTWLGALFGAGFVLLGGIATALMLRSPALNTSVSPATIAAVPPQPAAIIERPAPPPAEPTPQLDTTRVDAPETPAPSDSSARPSRATIASLQAGLRQLGYETGGIDGVMGPRTAAAIKAFQYAEHLTADGTLSEPTRAVLLRRIGEP